MAEVIAADLGRDQIAQAAYFLWLQAGGGHGRHVDDWLAAEHELRKQMRDAALELLLGELRDGLVAWLVNKGFDMSPGESTDVSRALEACLRVLHRTIPPQPRNVHWSKELRAKTLDAQTQAVLATIESEFRNGDDLNPRLTRQYFDAGFDDRLLNDLRVTHLHLGAPGAGKDKTKTRTMAGGTKEILWVVVLPADAFFIDVLDHSAFSTFDFVVPISKNWKHLLGKPLPGASNLEPKLSAEGRARFRKVGITTAIEVDGEIFLPGGYMGSGLSVEVAFAADRILNRVVEMHRWLAGNIDVVLAKIEEIAGFRPVILDLRPGDIDELLVERPTIVDQRTGMVFYQKGNEIRYRVPVASVPPAERAARARQGVT